MSETTWDIQLFNQTGTGVTGAAYETALYANSNHIRYAFDRSWSIGLNTYDQLDFSLYLDDPMAALIRRGQSVIKMYRSISDTVHSKTLTPSSSLPEFCGVVGYTSKRGEDGTMKISCYSPLWRLQSHFHLLNHYLNINPDTDDYYTQSELIWKLIDLVNGAFGGDSFTGIAKGNFLWGLPSEPQIAPYFVNKGTNTWSNIFDDIMQRPAGPDIIPRYYHNTGTRTQMYLDTDEARGTDKSATIKFNYHTTSPVANCTDMTEETQIVPGDFANYLWVVGQGGPNSGKVAARMNTSSSANSDGSGEIGVYMARVDRDEVKRVDALSPIAQAEFNKRKKPQPAYTVSLAPSHQHGLYYTLDFTVGDVVALNANKGALVVSNVKQRIYNATVSISNNNIESVEVELSDDFQSKLI